MAADSLFESERKEANMNINVGMVDRILRVLVGLALIAWALGSIPGVKPQAWGWQVWGWIGLAPLLTALLGPAYSMFGLRMCRPA